MDEEIMIDNLADHNPPKSYELNNGKYSDGWGRGGGRGGGGRGGNNKGNDKHKDNYDSTMVTKIRTIYLIAVILWTSLIFLLDLYENDIIVWFFLLLPFLIYGINFFSAEHFSCCMEDHMLQGNFLSFGFLITIILINWNSPLGGSDKTKFFLILVVAFILLMISLIDVWVDDKNLSIVKHIKTSLHTASLSLLALSLYLYYIYQRDTHENTPKISPTDT